MGLVGGAPWENLWEMCFGSNLVFLAWFLEGHAVFKHGDQR